MTETPENTQEYKPKLTPEMIAAQWKPGQSGNPGGRPKKRLIDQLLEELLESADSKDAKKIAEALIRKAKKGDSKAAQLIAERTEGKPVQKVEHTGGDGGPIQAKVLIEFVDSGAD